MMALLSTGGKNLYVCARVCVWVWVGGCVHMCVALLCLWVSGWACVCVCVRLCLCV